MRHRTRNEQKAFSVRKANNPKVRTTKIHTPKPIYNRKRERQEITLLDVFIEDCWPDLDTTDGETDVPTTTD